MGSLLEPVKVHRSHRARVRHGVDHEHDVAHVDFRAKGLGEGLKEHGARCVDAQDLGHDAGVVAPRALDPGLGENVREVALAHQLVSVLSHGRNLGVSAPEFAQHAVHVLGQGHVHLDELAHVQRGVRGSPIGQKLERSHQIHLPIELEHQILGRERKGLVSLVPSRPLGVGRTLLGHAPAQNHGRDRASNGPAVNLSALAGLEESGQVDLVLVLFAQVNLVQELLGRGLSDGLRRDDAHGVAVRHRGARPVSYRPGRSGVAAGKVRLGFLAQISQKLGNAFAFTVVVVRLSRRQTRGPNEFWIQPVLPVHELDHVAGLVQHARRRTHDQILQTLRHLSIPLSADLHAHALGVHPVPAGHLQQGRVLGFEPPYQTARDESSTQPARQNVRSTEKGSGRDVGHVLPAHDQGHVELVGRGTLAPRPLHVLQGLVVRIDRVQVHGRLVEGVFVVVVRIFEIVHHGPGPNLLGPQQGPVGLVRGLEPGAVELVQTHARASFVQPRVGRVADFLNRVHGRVGALVEPNVAYSISTRLLGRDAPADSREKLGILQGGAIHAQHGVLDGVDLTLPVLVHDVMLDREQELELGPGRVRARHEDVELVPVEIAVVRRGHVDVHLHGVSIVQSSLAAHHAAFVKSGLTNQHDRVPVLEPPLHHVPLREPVRDSLKVRFGYALGVVLQSPAVFDDGRPLPGLDGEHELAQVQIKDANGNGELGAPHAGQAELVHSQRGIPGRHAPCGKVHALAHQVVSNQTPFAHDAGQHAGHVLLSHAHLRGPGPPGRVVDQQRVDGRVQIRVQVPPRGLVQLGRALYRSQDLGVRLRVPVRPEHGAGRFFGRLHRAAAVGQDQDVFKDHVFRFAGKGARLQKSFGLGRGPHLVVDFDGPVLFVAHELERFARLGDQHRTLLGRRASAMLAHRPHVRQHVREVVVYKDAHAPELDDAVVPELARLERLPTRAASVALEPRSHSRVVQRPHALRSVQRLGRFLVGDRRHAHFSTLIRAQNAPTRHVHCDTTYAQR